MADFDFAPGFSYPVELAYTMPTQVPPGMRQVQLRQLNYNNIPQPTVPGTEIIINIPQLDYSFLDPSTTSINVRGFLTIQLKYTMQNAPLTGQVSTYCAESGIYPANALLNVQTTDLSTGALLPQQLQSYPPLEALSFNPNVMLGKGWGMFRRYQVYMNGNQLTDDIENIGILQNYLQLLLSDRTYDGSNFEQSSTNGSIAGTNYAFQFPGHPDTFQDYTTEVGSTATAFGAENVTTQDLKYQGANVSYSRGSGLSTASTYDATRGVYQIPFEFSLPLFGILGANNSKMVPMFLGPIRIQLYTESLSNFIEQSNYTQAFAAVRPSTLLTPPSGQSPIVGLAFNTEIDFNMSSVTYSQVEFVGNYIRCDGSAFQEILQALPVPGKIIMRTESFVYSSYALPAAASGIQDLLISSRRASCKYIMTLCNNSLLSGKSYGSVCPWLTNGTCVMINGVMYPQQGKDFLNKPRDCYRQTLTTLNLAYSALTRPAIQPQNWLRLSTLKVPTSTAVANPTAFGNLQTVQQTYSVRYNDNNLSSPLDANNCPQYAFAFLPNAATTPTNLWGAITQKPLYSLTTKQNYWEDAVVAGYTYNVEEAKSRGSPVFNSMTQNQWVDITDTEVFGRRMFLSGQSTLSGSCFYHMNIYQPLPPVNHVMSFFMFFDAITVMDVTTKQVVWKI